jgi:plastocyanin
MRRLGALRMLGASVIALAACGGASDATSPPDTTGTGPATAVVSTPGNTFSPPFTTIGVGGSVRFEIRGAAHNVIFSTAGAPANVNVVTNTDATRTFNTRGTFPYDCTVHPGMSGEIVVQ